MMAAMKLDQKQITLKQLLGDLPTTPVCDGSGQLVQRRFDAGQQFATLFGYLPNLPPPIGSGPDTDN